MTEEKTKGGGIVDADESPPLGAAADRGVPPAGAAAADREAPPPGAAAADREALPPGATIADRGVPPLEATAAGGAREGMGRRDFLRRAGAGAGALAAAGSMGSVLTACEGPAAPLRGRGRNVVVIGAGVFGSWTALALQESGAQVTLVDSYGPGNSRSTSGDETRGVRSSYGNREQWVDWANRSIARWKEFDEEWSATMGGDLYFSAGDLILRDEWGPQLEEHTTSWDKFDVPYEVLTPEEITRRWPQIRLDDIGVGLYEPNAGVVRSRAACQRVADVFRRKGGEVRIGHATPGTVAGGRLQDIVLEPGGERLGADLFVFALGPWFPKAFPELMGERIRIATMGHVYYFGTPPGDDRFSHPNMPSYSFPGVTGWATLPPDHRGFRIRTGGSAANDPDTSVRWIPEQFLEQPRAILRERFPALADQPIVETRACHYELSVTRDWVIDVHPEMDNAWIAGGGSAEGFKFGPMLGDLIAGRVLGHDRHPELTESFRIREEDLASASPSPGTQASGRLELPEERVG